MRSARLVAAAAACAFSACGGGRRGGVGGLSFGADPAGHAVVANPGGAADVQFGSSVAWIDWNQDGRPDVVSGSPGQAPGSHAGAGSAFLYLQNVDGTFSLARTLVASDWAGGVVTDAAWFGSTLCVGDFDGDGRPDVAIGAPGDAVGVDPAAGQVYVLFNTSDHSGALVGPVADPLGAQADAGFGSVLSCGRIDADLAAELVVGSPDATVSAHTLAGRVTVLLGGPAGSYGAAFVGPVTSASPASDESFGSALAVADMTGDGLADLVVGVPGMATGPGGAVQIWKQVAGPAFTLHATVTTTEPGVLAEFGATLAVADVDGDGDMDLVVGAPYGDVAAQTEAGYAVVLRNVTPAAGTFSESLVQDRVPEFGAQFGGAVLAQDVTRDGVVDLLVAAPAATQGALGSAGHFAVFRGLGGGSFATPSSGEVFASAAPAADAAFSASLDLVDANGDGIPDAVVGVPGPIDALDAVPGAFEVLRSK